MPGSFNFSHPQFEFVMIPLHGLVKEKSVYSLIKCICEHPNSFRINPASEQDYIFSPV